MSFRFSLKEAQNIVGCGDSVVRGCEFLVNPIEPIDFEVEGCPKLHTGEDFHNTIKEPFMFKDETHGQRESKKTLVVKLPPFVPPKCTFSVSTAFCFSQYFSTLMIKLARRSRSSSTGPRFASPSRQTSRWASPRTSSRDPRAGERAPLTI